MTAGLLLLLALAARAEPRALLFAPDPAALDWAAFRGLVSSSTARFTAALPPSSVPEPERAWLREAAASGRLELALRLPDDPLLPLLAGARPAALRERLALERAVARAAFGAVPRGFVAAGALLDDAARRALSEAGLGWTAAGPGGFSRPWDAGGLLAVPLRPASTDAARAPEAGEPPGVLVEDAAALAAALEARRQDWTTASEAIASAEAFAVAPASWPAWGGAQAWLTREDAERYARAAAAVERYQNSGGASLARLEAAASALDRAAAARHHRPEASKDALQAALREVYRAVGESPPSDETRPGSVTAEPLPGRGVAFSAVPASTAAAMPVSLRATRSAGGVEVTIALSSPAAAAEVEAYIDVNGLPGRGSTRLLGGRRPLIAARDAWEFAVVIAGGAASLWRVGTPPVQLEDLAVREEAAALRVIIPARRLRGNPSGWGWLVVTDDGALGAASLALPEEGAPPLLRAARLLGDRL